MEQKQLDEMEESFSGEEFIDDTDFAEEVIIEQMRPRAKAGVKTKPKMINVKKADKKSTHPAEGMKVVAAGKEIHNSHAKVEKEKVHKLEVESKPVKTEPVAATAYMENPWKDEKTESSNGGFFKEASTWKGITAIAIIVLILSVFTQGFNFSAESESSITTAEAEQQVLTYVNTNLLRAPFLAEVKASQEVDNLYKVTLSVAGQEVDSYITKDGKLFFPQGFDTTQSLESELTAPESTEEETLVAEEATTETVEVAPSENEAEAAPVEEPAAPVEAENGPVEFTLTAKKWLFTPNKVTVQRGQVVSLTIVPENLQFTFAIPDLDVEQGVNGETKVQFSADTPGTYQFSCSSCEEWRGMTGTIVVQ